MNKIAKIKQLPSDVQDLQSILEKLLNGSKKEPLLEAIKTDDADKLSSILSKAGVKDAESSAIKLVGSKTVKGPKTPASPDGVYVSCEPKTVYTTVDKDGKKTILVVCK